MRFSAYVLEGMRIRENSEPDLRGQEVEDFDLGRRQGLHDAGMVWLVCVWVKECMSGGLQVVGRK